MDVAAQGRGAIAVVSYWEQLDRRERADLAEQAAWPRAVVLDESAAVCGLLMPLLPDDFFCGQPDPKTGAPTKLSRTMKWLASTAAQRRAAGVDIPDVHLTDRYALLAKLAYVLARLHQRGWVYGDLSFNSVAFALDPPRIQLLDCDSAARLDDLSRTQAHTPFWVPPECRSDAQRVQDERTDVYKLGLMILRCLTPGKGVATTEDPERLQDVDGGSILTLVARALDTDRSLRLTAADLCLELQWLAARATGVGAAA
ncbi:MAG: hypothetical protein M3340_01865 [Actinomycetota bacterium]|nr:hypothetical protein [Actinomycetota bacterium]